MRELSRKARFPNYIHGIPPIMKILNMVIQFWCSLAALSKIGALQAPYHIKKCDVINDVKQVH